MDVEGRGQPLRKLFLLIAGWVLVVVGVLLTPAPVPIPLIGVVPLLGGCAILSRHSRLFRRGLQRLRHRYRIVSRFFEHFGERAPAYARAHVKAMVSKTDPRAVARHLRRRAST